MLARWLTIFGSLFLVVSLVKLVEATDTPSPATSSHAQSEANAMQSGTTAVTSGVDVNEKPQGDAPAKQETPDAGSTMTTVNTATTVASEMTTSKESGSTVIHSSVLLVTICGLATFLKVSA